MNFEGIKSGDCWVTRISLNLDKEEKDPQSNLPTGVRRGGGEGRLRRRTIFSYLERRILPRIGDFGNRTTRCPSRSRCHRDVHGSSEKYVETEVYPH